MENKAEWTKYYLYRFGVLFDKKEHDSIEWVKKLTPEYLKPNPNNKGGLVNVFNTEEDAREALAKLKPIIGVYPSMAQVLSYYIEVVHCHGGEKWMGNLPESVWLDDGHYMVHTDDGWHEGVPGMYRKHRETGEIISQNQWEALMTEKASAIWAGYPAGMCRDGISIHDIIRQCMSNDNEYDVCDCVGNPYIPSPSEVNVKKDGEFLQPMFER